MEVQSETILDLKAFNRLFGEYQQRFIRFAGTYVSDAATAEDIVMESFMAAWEKRGYWVKADRFRLDWEWSGRLGTSMRQAVLAEDWATVAGLSAQVGQKLAKVSVPVRHRLGTPWVGAWKHIKSN